MHNDVVPPPPHLIFSIIIPVFNTEKYIERCLKSCIEQTYNNIEIIVVDDCGQDQAMWIVERYAKEDARIRILKNQRNLGLFHTRIAGESFAIGNFIIHVDSDDFIEIDACERIAKAVEDEYGKTNSYPDICWFASKRLFSRKTRIYHPSLVRSEKNEVFKNNMMQWEIWGKAYGRELVQKVDIELTKILSEDVRLLIGEDVVKLFAINLFAQKSIGIDEVLYFYCENPTSITKTRNNSQIAQRNAEQLDFVIRFLDRFDTIQEAQENPYYLSTKKRVQEVLEGHKKMWEYQAFIAHRFDNIFFAYPRVYWQSMKIQKDWRRFCIRVFVYFATLGFVKI